MRALEADRSLRRRVLTRDREAAADARLSSARKQYGGSSADLQKASLEAMFSLSLDRAAAEDAIDQAAGCELLHLVEDEPLASDDAAPAVWHSACAGLGRERGLFVPAEPAPAPGASTTNASTAAAMAWKRLFFNQLWPARFKWADQKRAKKRDFKIEVCVRFRPEAEGSDDAAARASSDVVLPLHQRAAGVPPRRASVRVRALCPLVLLGSRAS